MEKWKIGLEPNLEIECCVHFEVGFVIAKEKEEKTLPHNHEMMLFHYGL